MESVNAAMQERFNKPKVFLSHAWEDKPFIQKVASDLRRCGIEYWIDTENIRDGESWLRMIFEDGIPTCDAVLVYFTVESLSSKMVGKEWDAAVLHQLSQKGVRLLPYVSDGRIRSQLRSDIQTLQCREWNDSNYDEVFPTVVAEIWRNYLERTVETAILQEKSRRLEQELENKRLKEQYESYVFSPREEQEFQYLRTQFNRKIEITFPLYRKDDNDDPGVRAGTEICRPSILHILLATIESGGLYFDPDYFGFYLCEQIGRTLITEGVELKRYDFRAETDKKITAKVRTEVHTYGLTTLTQIEGGLNRRETAYQISDKMYRFKYWLEYNNLVTDANLERSVTLLSRGTGDTEEEPYHDQQSTVAAKELDQRISEVRRRREWSTSGEGVAVAGEFVEALFDILETRTINSNKDLEHIEFAFQSHLNGCQMSAKTMNLFVEWDHPSDDTADCVLRLFATMPDKDPHSESPIRQIFACDLRVNVNDKLRLKWSRKDGSYGDFFSPQKLADFCWSTFINLIRQNEEHLA